MKINSCSCFLCLLLVRRPLYLRILFLLPISMTALFYCDPNQDKIKDLLPMEICLESKSNPQLLERFPYFVQKTIPNQWTDQVQ